MRILFCTDGSKISYDAIRNFAKWAKEDSIVDTICVIDWSFLPDETVIEEVGFVNNCRSIADNILEYSEKEIIDLNLKLGEKIKLCGAAVESILEQLDTDIYDMVIMGSHGKKGIQRWLGSVSREILEASNIPAYISKEKNKAERILFTTDGSEASFNIAKKAIEYLKLDNKEVYICTVTENPDLLFLEGTLDTNWMLAIRAQQEIYSDKALKTMIELFDQYKIEVKQSQILEGMPAQSILDFIKEKEIDLVVLGSKVKTKMQSFLLDSVSKRVVENVKSDAFVIKITTGYQG